MHRSLPSLYNPTDMPANAVAIVSLEQLKGSQATFPPKQIDLAASEDWRAILGRASGPTPSGDAPTCEPNNGLFPSLAVDKEAGSRSVYPRHAELVFDPVRSQVSIVSPIALKYVTRSFVLGHAQELGQPQG
ncbi:hypothetical protein CONPUDRAFT_138053 [Coniophora puteana RWD-64-598 SS2]|uniref:Uncharacterized protein n=1 Tax=Coniophora puteana (strain RWD-64-598) TaxID=741705 RepID=A0A5M3MKX9_CONPW|nr:uncharacterized protein CONPUDRAFT_138053 [Coniophora puteana RWD-64-598 SS2]EIW79882.1 hypothetical protein CONPUDRAFT_138053 [Coniophora puteana RWD-64-598 SS2]